MPARRTLLIGLGAAGAAAAWIGLPALLPAPPLAFAPIPGLPGFRRMDGGATSASGDPFIGLAAAPDPDLPAALHLDDPCPLLTAPTTGTVPVTLFTDVFCAVCRGFEPLLDARAGDTVTLSRTPLPRLGPGSVAAARATIAAEAQDAGAALHARLMRARFQPGPDYLTAIAQGLGLDAPRLLADARSPATTTALARSLGLAERFGLYATPSMIVGRTAVLGALDAATLDRLIAAEAALPPACPAQ